MPGESPPVLRVEGWYLDGNCRLLRLQPALVAPECAGVERISPSELAQMTQALETSPEADLRERAWERLRRLSDAPLRAVVSSPPLGSLSGCKNCCGSIRVIARALLERANYLLEVDRLRRTIPPGAVDARPDGAPSERAWGPLRRGPCDPTVARSAADPAGRKATTKGSLWSHSTAPSSAEPKCCLGRWAGVGKTRLADWLFRAARREGLSDGLQVRDMAPKRRRSVRCSATFRARRSTPRRSLIGAQWLRRR